MDGISLPTEECLSIRLGLFSPMLEGPCATQGEFFFGDNSILTSKNYRMPNYRDFMNGSSRSRRERAEREIQRSLLTSLEAVCVEKSSEKCQPASTAGPRNISPQHTYLPTPPLAAPRK